jgi:hypothetical protein
MNTDTHVAPLSAVQWGGEEGAGTLKSDLCNLDITYGMYRAGTQGKKITKTRLLRNCLKARRQNTAQACDSVEFPLATGKVS